MQNSEVSSVHGNREPGSKREGRLGLPRLRLASELYHLGTFLPVSLHGPEEGRKEWAEGTQGRSCLLVLICTRRTAASVNSVPTHCARTIENKALSWWAQIHSAVFLMLQASTCGLSLSLTLKTICGVSRITFLVRNGSQSQGD